jgi:putative tributyrin esterase
MNPERYRACCAFAPACPPLDGWLEDIRQNGETEAYRAKWGSQMPADFRAIFGENLEWQAENDLAELAQRCSYPKDRMEIYMTCGDGDYLLQYVEQFYAEMQTLGYTVDYEKWTGRHDMPFFDESLKKALGKYLAWK